MLCGGGVHLNPPTPPSPSCWRKQLGGPEPPPQVMALGAGGSRPPPQLLAFGAGGSRQNQK